MVSEFHLSAEDFGRVRQLISTYAGIWLNDRKRELVLNRLSGRLRARRVRTFGEYLDGVEAPGSPERECFVNALTTNVTAFFREQHHFAKLAERVRAVQRRGAPVRVWSCACSTGEEPYSAAMVLREAGSEAELIFGESNPVQSEALMRLDVAGSPGMLAFGSSDPPKFDPGHGTDLLVFLAAAVERLLVQRLSENEG